MYFHQPLATAVRTLKVRLASIIFSFVFMVISPATAATIAGSIGSRSRSKRRRKRRSRSKEQEQEKKGEQEEQEQQEQQ